MKRYALLASALLLVCVASFVAGRATARPPALQAEVKQEAKAKVTASKQEAKQEEAAAVATVAAVDKGVVVTRRRRVAAAPPPPQPGCLPCPTCFEEEEVVERKDATTTANATATSRAATSSSARLETESEVFTASKVTVAPPELPGWTVGGGAGTGADLKVRLELEVGRRLFWGVHAAAAVQASPQGERPELWLRLRKEFGR